MRNHTPSFGDSPPIPSYEEATSSRPSSAPSFRGPQETSDDAERQGLLPGEVAHQRQSGRDRDHDALPQEGRSSVDGLDASIEDDDLRRDLEQMELEDSPSSPPRRRIPGLPKRIAGITESFSSFHLPTVRLPSMRSFTSPVLSILTLFKPNWPIFGRVIALLLILLLVYGLVIMRIFTWKVAPQGQQYVPESVRKFVQSSVDPESIRNYLYEVTFDDHVAGTKGNFFLAEWIEERFNEAGLDDVYNDDYQVYLNYPKEDGRRVAIVSPPELEWQAVLEEEVVAGKSEQHQVPVFHGNSKSGNVTGPLIYANYGSREDFTFLKDNGIELAGSIVLVRYYGTQGDRSLKVKAAELAGAAGCLIYSDPIDDGFLKGKVWPDGPWRPSDGVQRGSVSLSSWVIGDPLTPGWASVPDADRISVEDAKGLVNIPSLPLAWRDAQVLLQSMKGKGHSVPEKWVGGVPDVNEWWTGDSSTSPQVNLMNLQDEVEKQPIRNVIGKITGIESEEKMVYIGNHRDAWCFGSVDPGSGTAVFLEVVRIFGELVQNGWRPRRTIVFASWDAEEYNMIGSTEHVEDRIEALRNDGVAYLNVDVGVSGATFRAAGSPLFERVLNNVLDRVLDPATNNTLRQTWNESNMVIEGLGAGSDYVAFQDLAGCSSLDFGFEGPENGFPYHSCYESFDWMTKFGDPDFQYHATLAQIWALLLLELADEPILPFDLNAYAREVTRYVTDLQGATTALSGILDVKNLASAAQDFVDNAATFMGFEDIWSQTVSYHGMMENREIALHRMAHNARMALFETHLLDLPLPNEDREGGVPGRTQYKHVIFGPQTWSGYDDAKFPAVVDAMEEGDWVRAQEWVEITARILRKAADHLVHM